MVRKQQLNARHRRVAPPKAEGGPDVASRICLACDKRFLSDGPWNRICPRCSGKATPPPLRAMPHRVHKHN